jgi:hypothetical protein
VVGGVMTPPYNALQIISPLNYNWYYLQFLWLSIDFRG